jgi:pimeloyl-ACP methyl ester carboxylesterase
MSPAVQHRSIAVDGATVHVRDAGHGPTIMLVHGFPETSAVFAGLVPLLADRYRVLAVDLPGFGGSEAFRGFASVDHAAALAELIETLHAGPVHLLGQDVSGALTYRLAATRPDLVASWTAVETVLPGFGFETLAGAAWYIGMLAAPGAAELLLPGRERGFLVDHVLTPQSIVAPSQAVVDELVATYTGTRGFAGAVALYRALLAEGPELQALAATPLGLPVRTLSSTGGQFVPDSVREVAPDLTHVDVPGVGHYIALEAPTLLAENLVAFVAAL